MKRNLLALYGNIKRINTSIKANGLRNTINKIKLHLRYKDESPIFDFILLKPVKKPWKSTNKLHHTYDMSVIIPTYNRSHMLPEILSYWKEVDKATRYSYEIIFSDDGSDDESIQILEAEKSLPIKVIQNAHGGASKARNSAIRTATGKKLFIIGDDIFPNKEIINQHIEKLNSLSITDAVLGECVWHPDLKVNHLMDHITEKGCEQFSFVHFPKHGFTDFRHFYTCNISIDREFLLSESTIFNEAFYKYGFEDIELGYRLAKKGMKIYYYPEAYGYHFHPYHSVRKFCNRQEFSGEMAVVFKTLHNEIEPVVDTNNITSKWSFALPQNIQSNTNIYNEIIAFCQYIEDNYETRNSELSKDLSILYAALFRFAYEKGVFGANNEVKDGVINEIFTAEFMSNKIQNALMNLQEYCSVPYGEKIFGFLKNQKQSTKLLTIEARDLEHLDLLLSKYGSLSEMLNFRIKSETITEGMVYKPERGFFLHVNNLRQILLFLQEQQEVDFIFLSFGLHNLPEVGISDSINNSCICSCKNTLYENRIDTKTISRGKIIRIFETCISQKVVFYDLLREKIGLLDDYGFFGVIGTEKKHVLQKIPEVITQKKPIIFVFPIFLAVGGVERNTSEMIKKLSSQYDFVVITFERLQQSHGTLHHQFLDACVGLYDLTELSSHDMILHYLHKLKKIYNPHLIWICNGSPWLTSNLMALRMEFQEAAIVDQEVYDTEAGWVQLYKQRNPGLLAFDRFIAINSKIKGLFIDEIQIDKSKVDLIYSVMSIAKREEALQSSKEELLAKYGLNVDQKYIVFIGRLVEQKAPMDLLKLISIVSQKYGNEYKFIIVGSGALDEKVSQYINDNHLSETVLRFKFIENTFEMSIIADAIIFTSLFEGLSIALLEALSVGTPGISTDVGDTKLIFNEYGNGIVFQTIGDTNEYVETFEHFVSNYIDYKENAQKYKDEIAKRFSAEYIALEYEDCFNRAIKAKQEFDQ